MEQKFNMSTSWQSLIYLTLVPGNQLNINIFRKILTSFVQLALEDDTTEKVENK